MLVLALFAWAGGPSQRGPIIVTLGKPQDRGKTTGPDLETGQFIFTRSGVSVTRLRLAECSSSIATLWVSRFHHASRFALHASQSVSLFPLRPLRMCFGFRYSDFGFPLAFHASRFPLHASRRPLRAPRSHFEFPWFPHGCPTPSAIMIPKKY